MTDRLPFSKGRQSDYRQPSLIDGLLDSHIPVRLHAVREVRVRDESILLNRSESELIALNQSGRAIYGLCNNERTVSEIVDELEKLFDADRSVIRQNTAELLIELIDKDFIAIRRRPSEIRIVDPIVPVIVGFKDKRVQIYTDVPKIREWLERWFEMLLTDAPGQVVKRIGISMMGEYYHVSGCRRSDITELSFNEMSKSVKHEIDRRLIDSNSGFLWFHAGAVSKNGFAILFGGNYGAGKSTTICGLYKRGWTFHSDDLVPVDPASGMVHAFPLTPRYRVNELDGLLDEDEIYSLKRIIVDLDPDKVATAGVPIGALVFPKYTPGESATMTRLSPSQAIVELIGHSLNYKAHGIDALENLAQILEDKPVFLLEYGDNDAAVDVVESTFIGSFV